MPSPEQRVLAHRSKCLYYLAVSMGALARSFKVSAFSPCASLSHKFPKALKSKSPFCTVAFLKASDGFLWWYQAGKVLAGDLLSAVSSCAEQRGIYGHCLSPWLGHVVLKNFICAWRRGSELSSEASLQRGAGAGNARSFYCSKTSWARRKEEAFPTIPMMKQHWNIKATLLQCPFLLSLSPVAVLVLLAADCIGPFNIVAGLFFWVVW